MFESRELTVDVEHTDLLADETLDFSGERWLVRLLGDARPSARKALFSLASFLERREGEQLGTSLEKLGG